MRDLREMTVSELTLRTWSKSPTPGGGSISALVGSLAAALTGMASNLSQGEARTVAEEMDGLRIQMLAAMQEDAEFFSQYMMALSMPKNTEEEKETRRITMQNCIKQAAEAPLRVAESLVSLFGTIETVIRYGNPNLITDALIAAMLARTAILSAVLNVKINLVNIQDEAFEKRVQDRISELECAALNGENAVLSLSELSVVRRT